MAKGDKKSGGNNNNNNNNINQAVVDDLKNQINELKMKNRLLEERMDKLQDKQGVLSQVNSMLSLEVDRLNQYTRRSNVVIKNVFAPENETVPQVEEEVKKIITNMGLPEVIPDFDKAHRLGKIRTINGKQHQDVIVRFKSHSARYSVFKKRKSAKNHRIAPNLTKTRSALLAEAANFTKEKIGDDWGFVFANEHGDLLVRLKDKFRGKHYFPFNSIESLSEKLIEVGLLEQ